jgi:hypothetical protein
VLKSLIHACNHHLFPQDSEQLTRFMNTNVIPFLELQEAYSDLKMMAYSFLSSKWEDPAIAKLLMSWLLLSWIFFLIMKGNSCFIHF